MTKVESGLTSSPLPQIMQEVIDSHLMKTKDALTSEGILRDSRVLCPVLLILRYSKNLRNSVSGTYQT